MDVDFRFHRHNDALAAVAGRRDIRAAPAGLPLKILKKTSRATTLKGPGYGMVPGKMALKSVAAVSEWPDTNRHACNGGCVTNRKIASFLFVMQDPQSS
jgi:hypothetical protein